MVGPRLCALIVAEPALGRLVAALLEHAGCAALVLDASPDGDIMGRALDADLLVVDLDSGADLPAFAPWRRAATVGLSRRATRLRLEAFRRGIELVAIPCPMDELVTRLCAALRRAGAGEPRIHPRVHLDRIEIDLLAQRARIGGRVIRLSDLELLLLCILAASAGEVVRRESIIRALWGGLAAIGSNVVDRHVRDLRVKLGDDWRAPRYIETVSGSGYRWIQASDVDAEPVAGQSAG